VPFHDPALPAPDTVELIAASDPTFR